MTKSIRRSAMPGRGILACLCATLLATGSALAGPPFRTDDPEPVEFQHFEINLFSQGTKVASGWTAALPAFEVNYGALPNLQLHAIIPQGYTAPTGGRAGFALGDIELGAKYRFISPEEDDWFPEVAAFPLIEVPVGNQKLGFSTGHAQIFLPLWLQKEFGPWTVYGGGGYWINPGVGNKDYGFFGAAVWRKITEQFNLGVEVFHQTANVVGGRESTGFNVGTTYDLSENWHVLSSVGTGLQNRSTTNQFSYYLGLQLTF
jgi:hypothetical protein